MSQVESDYQILQLTDEFYNAYPNPPYREILEKRKRAYNCFVFQTHYGYFICVPYRSEVRHKYAYHFRKSKRSKTHKSALDYTKIIIIKNPDYIGIKDAIIDKDEYIETINNINTIKKGVLKFVEEYISHVKGENFLAEEEFNRRYTFSPLQYFHKELGL